MLYCWRLKALSSLKIGAVWVSNTSSSNSPVPMRPVEPSLPEDLLATTIWLVLGPAPESLRIVGLARRTSWSCCLRLRSNSHFFIFD